MEPGSCLRPSLISVFIGFHILIYGVQAQDWFAYPSMFGGFNGYATHGPQATWDNSQFGTQNQGGLNQNEFVQSQTMQTQIDPSTQNVMSVNPGNQGIVDQSVTSHGLVDPPGTLLEQQNQYHQWQGIQTSENTGIGDPSGGMVLGPAHPAQTEIVTSSPSPFKNTSVAPSKDQQKTASVVANGYQDPGPPPMDAIHASQQQWQSLPDPNLDPIQTFDQTSNYNIQATQPEHVTFETPVQENNPVNSSRRASQGQIDSSAVQHYIMPPGIQNVNVWPAVPHGTYPVHPERNAQWINRMREAAMRFYGKYPPYRVANQMVPVRSTIPSRQNQNWVSGTPTTGLKQSTLSTQNYTVASQQPVVRSKQGVSIQQPLERKSNNLAPSVGNVQNTSHSDMTVSESNSRRSTTESSSIRTGSPLSELGTPATDTSQHSLSKLTPHKNMTNAELHKIIRILLIPHKLKQISKAKKKKGKNSKYKAKIDTRPRPPPPPVSPNSYQRRPVSEMHIKMVNFAPNPHKISANTHLSLPSVQHPPLSEIYVKLVNYDQQVVDTFNSQVLSPHSRLAQPKWVSAAGPKGAPKAVNIQPISNNSPNITSSDAQRDQKYHKNTSGPGSPSSYQLAQEDVKYHQKAVVRHTQMLHHVMGRLANEMNRFKGSVRHSRHTAAERNADFPKLNVNTSLLIPTPKPLSPSFANDNESTMVSKIADTPTGTILNGIHDTQGKVNLSISESQGKSNVSISDTQDQVNVSVSGPEGKTESRVPFQESVNIPTPTTQSWELKTTGLQLESLARQNVGLPPVPDLLSDLGITSHVTSEPSLPFTTSSTTPESTEVQTTVFTPPEVLTISHVFTGNKQNPVSGITALKIKDISPSKLIGEQGTEKTPRQRESIDTLKSHSKSKVTKVDLPSFYSAHKSMFNSTAPFNHSYKSKPILVKNDTLLVSESEAPVPVQHELSTQALAPELVSKSTPAVTDAVSQVYPDSTNQQLNNQLNKQLGVLDKLHRRQVLLDQQKKLKDQHARLKKQKELLQKQLKTLQKLRASGSSSPIGVPESSGGLAALFSGLQIAL